MSSIFNRHALIGLSTYELKTLHSSIRQRLCDDRLRDQERIYLLDSLKTIEALLRLRCTTPSTRGPVPSP